MPKIEKQYKEVPLIKIFRYISGNIEYNKSYCNSHQGKYPVYTATVEEPLGYIDTYEYDGEYFSWTVDGVNSGTVEILSGQFNTGNGRGLLVTEEKNISMRYIRFLLEPIFKKEAEGRGRGGTPHCKWSHIQNKKLRLPIRKDGTFDLEKQQELAEKYELIEEKKNKLLNRIAEIDEIAIRLPLNEEVRWAEVKITDLFSPANGDSKYTKTWCKAHEGSYPIYSGNTSGEYGFIDEYQYDGEYLTWAKDGLAGYMMYHNGRFSLTGHRGILIKKDNRDDIDLMYLKYVLEPVFRANKKGREGDLGKNEYTTINSDMIKKITTTIPIPLDENGEYDLMKQKELAGKYKQIDDIKNMLKQKILQVTSIVVQ